MSVTIFGHSDDTIEIIGDIHQEFYVFNGDNNGSKDFGILAFSNGCVLKVVYEDPGIWRITPICINEAYRKTFEATDPDGDRYSDNVTLEGTIDWVVMGNQYEKKK